MTQPSWVFVFCMGVQTNLPDWESINIVCVPGCVQHLELELTLPQQWDLSTGQVRVGKHLQGHHT